MTINFFLKNNLYDDDCYINVGFEVHVNHLKEYRAPGLLQLLELGKDDNVTFVVQGRKFYARREIVASQSAYLYK